tara:strand:- start:10489 stop:11244 length:756 start_codon:yes stop_codon:yes gene_type:complete
MHVVISDKYNLMVFYSGKCGCTTIKKIMEALDKDIYFCCGYSELKIYNKSHNLDIYKKIAIIRSPYDKFLSAFFHRLIKVSQKVYEKYILTLPLEQQTFNGFLENLNKFENIYEKTTNTDNIYNEVHIIPQLSQVYYYFKDQNWSFDTIYDIKNINEFIKFINNQYSLYLDESTHLNPGTSNSLKNNNSIVIATKSKKILNKNHNNYNNIHYKLLTRFMYKNFKLSEQNKIIIRNLYENDFIQFKEWGFNY